MTKLYIEMSEMSVVAQTLTIIAEMYGCLIVDDVADANRVVCLTAKSALSLMKQTNTVIDIFVLSLNGDDCASTKTLAERFPKRINVYYMFDNNGVEGFPLLLNSWIGGDK